jgi:hypothetical protein
MFYAEERSLKGRPSMASDNQKDVFVIRKVGSKTFWNRAGRAFVNSDGSVNVQLDLLPNVDLQIRDRKNGQNEREPGE